MAFTHVLIAVFCAAVLPATAQAQSPSWEMSTAGSCCATVSNGDALAAAVLLPSPLVLPADASADALAASALLPATDETPAPGCCQSATSAPGVDHSAHAGGGPAAAGSMGCCGARPCCGAHHAER